MLKFTVLSDLQFRRALAREERSRIRLRLRWLGGVVRVATMSLDRLPVDVPKGLLVSRPGLDPVHQVDVAVSVDW